MFLKKKSLVIMITIICLLIVCNACGIKNNVSTGNEVNAKDSTEKITQENDNKDIDILKEYDTDESKDNKIEIDDTINTEENRRCVSIISGLKETEYVVTSFESSFDEDEMNMLGEITTSIWFDSDQLDSFLQETKEDCFLIFPGNLNILFSEVTEEYYKKATGEEKIILENLFVKTTSKKNFRNGSIDERCEENESNMYYWRLDDGSYKAFFEYMEW